MNATQDPEDTIASNSVHRNVAASDSRSDSHLDEGEETKSDLSGDDVGAHMPVPCIIAAHLGALCCTISIQEHAQ